jgi:hypothetical protein
LAPLTGCAHEASVAARPPASAAFPDMSDFEAVYVRKFLEGYPYFGWVSFWTPSGLVCGYPTPFDAPHPPRPIECTGPLPAKGSGDWSIQVSPDRTATIEEAPRPNSPPTLQAQRNEYKTLLPRQKIEAPSITCGTVDDGTFACRTGEHGFIVTPTSTTLF